jgi:hypothetical protein
MAKRASADASSRRPRYRRANSSPNFRVTGGDVAIIRQIARHRFLRSTHIAALVGRSLDRTNDRLCHLYHAGYIDRPRAQLDYYPTAGSAPMVYALADRGARLLIASGGFEGVAHLEWSRRNRQAGRPFIEHQLEIADFEVAAQLSTEASGYHYMGAEEIVSRLTGRIAADPSGNPFSFRVTVAHQGARHEIGLVPDIAFAVDLNKGANRNFFVEIDRGTMPITRADFSQTSIERKLRSYLSAHASRLFERNFDWKFFRVLFVTSDETRIASMIDALRTIQPPGAAGSSLFLFTLRDALRAADPFSATWVAIDGRARRLLD